MTSDKLNLLDAYMEALYTLACKAQGPDTRTIDPQSIANFTRGMHEAGADVTPEVLDAFEKLNSLHKETGELIHAIGTQMPKEYRTLFMRPSSSSTGIEAINNINSVMGRIQAGQHEVVQRLTAHVNTMEMDIANAAAVERPRYFSGALPKGSVPDAGIVLAFATRESFLLGAKMLVTLARNLKDDHRRMISSPLLKHFYDKVHAADPQFIHPELGEAIGKLDHLYEDCESAIGKTDSYLQDVHEATNGSGFFPPRLRVDLTSAVNTMTDAVEQILQAQQVVVTTIGMKIIAIFERESNAEPETAAPTTAGSPSRPPVSTDEPANAQAWPRSHLT